jgi:transposase-like protein
MLGIAYTSAWFMAHRIRYAMEQPPLSEKLTGIVEVDEVYIGGRRRGKKGRGARNKTPVLALVQRGGIVKSRPVRRVTAKNLKSFIRGNVDKNTMVMSDDYKSYKWVRKEYPHQIVRHSFGEYVRGNVHTNTIEGFFGFLKRGLNGIYQHVSPKHLHRYLTEFDFRYNMRHIEDGARTCLAFAGIEGKRLLYRDSLPKTRAI